MRFTYAEAMIRADFYLPLAQAGEAAGYDTMTVADSPCYPKESDATYPYTDDGIASFSRTRSSSRRSPSLPPWER